MRSNFVHMALQILDGLHDGVMVEIARGSICGWICLRMDSVALGLEHLGELHLLGAVVVLLFGLELLHFLTWVTGKYSRPRILEPPFSVSAMPGSSRFRCSLPFPKGVSGAFTSPFSFKFQIALYLEAGRALRILVEKEFKNFCISEILVCSLGQRLVQYFG